MDEEIQRAILLKALMLIAGQQGIALQEFEKDKARELGRPFTQFNATRQTLREGVEPYANTVRQMLLCDSGRLQLPAGPLWEQIRAFALGEPVEENLTLPRSLRDLQHWRPDKPSTRKNITSDMGGCWWIFRLTSKGGSDRQVTASLLNIRPEFYYETSPSKCIEFTLAWQGGNGESFVDQPPLTVHGICHHHNNQLHFLGILDKLSAPLPTAMVLHYEDGSTRRTHRRNSEGVLFTTSSHRVQISCPVVAVYIDGSADWRGDEYDEKRAALKPWLGSHDADKLAEILPPRAYEHLIRRSREEMVYESRSNL